MAQGVVKTKPSKSPTSISSKKGITKKGARTIAPKKAYLVKQQTMTKKFSAGLTAKTEKMLGQRVGHLELLGVSPKGKGKGESSKEERRQKGKKTEAVAGG